MPKFIVPKDYKKEVSKSAHDLSCVKRTTLHPGLVIPIHNRTVLAGDRFRLDIKSLIQSQPLVSQLMGVFKLKFMVFFDSDCNYYGYMDNNARRSTEDLLSMSRHRVDFMSLVDANIASGFSNFLTIPSQTSSQPLDSVRNRGVGRGSMFDFLGVPPGFGIPIGPGGSPFGDWYNKVTINIGPILTYLNIFRNYIANNQEDSFPYLEGRYLNQDPNSNFVYSRVPLSYLDDIMMYFRYQRDGVNLSNDWFQSIPDSEPARDALGWFWTSYLPSCAVPYGGLLLDTYLPDIWTNVLNYEQSNFKSVVSVQDNQFDIDTLRFRNKLQRLIDRFTVSGGRFSNWLRTVWGVNTRRDMDIPELIGVNQSYLDPTQLSATAQTGTPGADGSTDLGQFGGNFNRYRENKPHSFVASTPGRLMVLVSIIPCVDYCQGFNPELFETSVADGYFPEFSQLGFQSVPRKFYSSLFDRTSGALTSSSQNPDWMDDIVGKNVAWVNYMTDVNRVHGEFSNFGYYDYWVLQRRYSMFTTNEDGLTDGSFSLTQYIHPLEFQYPFVGQTLRDPNWMLQVGINIRAIRPIGRRYMPNLE